MLQRTLAQTFPNVIVAPYLVSGATDARHYAALTPNIYRFMPVSLTEAELVRVHGIGERVRVGDFVQAIRFYRTLLVNFSE
jgi:carboxypeptidase PM20D1